MEASQNGQIKDKHQSSEQVSTNTAQNAVQTAQPPVDDQVADQSLEMDQQELLQQMYNALEQEVKARQAYEAEVQRLAGVIQQLTTSEETAAIEVSSEPVMPTKLQEFGSAVKRSDWLPYTIPTFGVIMVVWIIGNSLPSKQFATTLDTYAALSAKNAELGQSVAEIQGRPNVFDVSLIRLPGQGQASGGAVGEQPLTSSQSAMQAYRPSTANIAGIQLLTVLQPANLREQPSTSSTVLWTVPANDKVQILSVEQDWLRVNWIQVDSSHQPNGFKILATGYISRNLVR